MADHESIRFTLPGVERPVETSRLRGPATRGAGAVAKAPEFLAEVSVRRHFELTAPARAAGAKALVSTPPLAADEVLALEMEDGFTLYTSAGRLADDLLRIDPDAKVGDAIRLDALRRDAPATRGLGDWVVRALSVLGIDDHWLLDKAAAKAKEWGGDALLQGVSWAGTKAVMWAIEEQLDREAGRLYAWSEEAGGELLAAAPTDFGDRDDDAPMLVFIHGTGSSTQGSFGELRRTDAQREWLALREKFGPHIYGFEHRTFSESPIENALQLARQLPSGARLSLVTHSRGGLVGDLLCAAGLDGLVDGSFERADPRLAQANQEDRENLRQLADLLAAKQFVIERYVRVASPAQGTLLASAHTDAFLSRLLHLIGMVPGLAGTPLHAVVKRVLLQIVKNRTDPRLVPGIEAMLPDSPLAALIGRAQPKDGAQIAVIAGDIEGSGLLKRAGVFLTDYLFFDAENNDLVVDTASMYGGIARNAGRFVFDQGEDVNHFRYFANVRTRRALQGWITEQDPLVLPGFKPIFPDTATLPAQRGALALATGKDEALQRRAQDVTGVLPVVVFLPGIMGSHLSVNDDRIWFDFLDLARGGLNDIAWGKDGIAPDGLFRMFYGDLCAHLLAHRHEVVTFAYDWRSTLADAARRLAEVIELALKRTEAAKQPVRLLTHSMGGLVVRALIAYHRDTWDRLVARDGGRWVMLGTPNRGSHGTVESLLGLSDTMRKLALLAPQLGLQRVVDIVAGFPGALQLLPRPDFQDAGGVRHDYYAPDFWIDFKQGNDSHWYGKNIGAIPAAEFLAAASKEWQDLHEELPNPERIAYVAGYGYETPCGIVREEGRQQRLRMIGTLHGDGTVTHASGLLEVLIRNQRVWYMPADHAGLAGTDEHFPALAELLERGETLRLPQTKPALRGAEALFRYESGPVLYPTQQELERALIGGRRPVRRPARDKHVLNVYCRAMDVRHAIYPILVGHYEGDAISGAEAQIDRYVVDNRLTLRHHLDAYAGAAGTVAVVLDEPNAAQARAGVRRGAIVVGLGSFGELKAPALSAAVRQGVLRYLLQLHDRSQERELPKSVGIASLLLGHNSTTRISIEDSVAIVVRAVMEANREFANASGAPLHIGKIEFIELFEDAAISAAKAVRELGNRLARDAERLGFRIDAAPSLACGEGMRYRLEAMPSSFDYWPRLIVTAPDNKMDSAAQGAQGLRYVFLSSRARAETFEQQRQPHLVEKLLEKSIYAPSVQYQPELARTLFHLLMPHEFKDAARQAGNLVLVVDQLTANLPWEMLAADDEPLIRTTAMVRQLATGNIRHHVRVAQTRRAYVVGNPSTAGYYRASSGGQQTDALPDLPLAAAEARAVADLVKAVGYEVQEAPPGAEGIDVINRLYEKPYRIVHISAHGMFREGPEQDRRTGVVLSDGLLLTAAEICALESVPDLVFLNCCHSGQMEAGAKTAYRLLAYSVAKQLIENGVRAVIATGWAVNDEVACRFAEAFYQSFLGENRPFGKAVYEARLAVYEAFPNSTTWGAFQAYGEPSFVMDPERVTDSTDDFRPAAPQEVVARIDWIREELAHNRAQGERSEPMLGKTIERLLGRGASTAWRQQPEVLYALARLYDDAGNFEQARRYYEQAIALEDKRGRVPIVAIQQLADMDVRAGAESGGAGGVALIRRGLERLLGLAQAVSATGKLQEGPINAQRCGLIGDAWERLANNLPDWDVPGTPELPSGARQALQHARDWYARGQGDPRRPEFSARNTYKRIALDTLLGDAVPDDAMLAEEIGGRAGALYAESHDYGDLIVAADSVLIKALADGSLEKKKAAVLQALEMTIIDGYRDLRENMPEAVHGLASVVAQLHLLAGLWRQKAQGSGGSAKVADSLQRIAAALEGGPAAAGSHALQPDHGPDGKGAMKKDAAILLPAAAKERNGKTGGHAAHHSDGIAADGPRQRKMKFKPPPAAHGKNGRAQKRK